LRKNGRQTALVRRATCPLIDLTRLARVFHFKLASAGFFYGQFMIAGSIEIQMMANMARLQRDMDQARQTVGGAMMHIEQTVNRAKVAIGGLLGMLGARQFAGMVDGYINLVGQLKNATSSQTEMNQAMANVRRISTTAQADITGIATAYARLSNNLKDANVQQSAVANITETVALALKVNGASVAETTSAMQQLSQAFGKGKLDGDEFRTLMEASPNVMRRVADGMGVPFGALKDLAAQGKITGEVLARVLSDETYLAAVREQAKEMQTLGGAFIVLKNKAMEYVGIQAQANGVVNLLTSGIGVLANNLNTLASVAIGLGAAKVAGILVGIGTAVASNISKTVEYATALSVQRAATLASAQAEVGATAATIAKLTAVQSAIVLSREEAIAQLASANASIVGAQAQINAARAAGALGFALASLTQGELALAAAMQARSVATAELALLGQQQARVSAQVAAAAAAQTAAQAGLTAATGAGGVVAGLASRALGLLGGPIGWITTLLGLGATAWALWGDSAKKSENAASESVAASTPEILANLDAQIEKLKQRNAMARAGLPELAKSDDPGAVRMRELAVQMGQAKNGTGSFANLTDDARAGQLQVLGEQYGKLYASLQNLNSETKIFESNGQKSKAAEWAEKYASKLQQMNAELTKYRQEVGAAVDPKIEQAIRDKFAKKIVQRSPPSMMASTPRSKP
jgi:tape measure domain-containing protein